MVGSGTGGHLLLDLDRAAGGHHRRREQRRHVTGAAGEHAPADAQRAGGRRGRLRRPRRCRRRRHRRRRSRAPWRARRAGRASAPTRQTAGSRRVPADGTARQPVQSRMCRRASPLGTDPAVVGERQLPRGSPRTRCRAPRRPGPAPIRARTSSDLTAGTDHAERRRPRPRRSCRPARASAAPSAAARAAAARRRSAAAATRAARRRRSGRATGGRTDLEHFGRRRESAGAVRRCSGCGRRGTATPQRQLALVRPQTRVGADEHVLERVLGVLREPGSICRV